MKQILYKLQIIIPSCPENLNSVLRMNCHERNNKKKYWHDVVWKLSLGKRPPTPLTKFHIKITRYAHRMLDYDGLAGSVKPIVDGLKHAKIIKDDSWAMTGKWDLDQMFRAKKDGKRMVVMITEYRDLDIVDML